MPIRTGKYCLAAALVLVPVTAGAGALTGLDLMSATVFQQRQSSFSGLALRARVQSPRFADAVSLMPTVEYWRTASTIVHPEFSIHSSRKDATLGVDARYEFRRAGLRPYAGLGLALHFLSSAVDAPNLGLDRRTDAVIKGGPALLAGFSYELAGQLENFLELKYHHLARDRQLKINWGLAINLR